MVRATYRLSLLCKATMRLTPDIHQMVREYLVILVGVPCSHVDDMLWLYVRHRGVFSFVRSGAIRPGICKKKPLPDMGADLDAVSQVQHGQRLALPLGCGQLEQPCQLEPNQNPGGPP